jgi:amino acid adenylation domain-containing protein
VLIVTLHTIVADELSTYIFARELSMLYQACSAGEPSPLPNLPFQYQDYTDWQRSRVQGDVGTPQVDYWRGRLAGVPPVLELPTDRPRPPVQTFRGAIHALALAKDLSQALERFGQHEGSTCYEVLLAAFLVLLSRHTGQQDIVVGAIVPGRDQARTEGMIGLFAKAAVIRIDCSGGLGFRQFLRCVSDTVRCAHKNADVPLNRLVDELQIERDASRNPLFQVLFSLVPSFPVLPAGWKLVDLDVDTGAAKVDLQLQLSDRPEGIVARFTYNTSLFDAATICQMGGHFERLLHGIVFDADRCVSALPLLTDAEQRRLLVEWNATQADYPRDRTIYQLFEEQVRRTPDATAVVFENESLTYGELNSRANQLARYLRKLDVRSDTLVGICVERSLEMIVGLLGILKAGGAYVPLDPAYPKERLSFMLEDAAVPVLLTQKRLLASLPKNDAKIIHLDNGWHEVAKERTEDLSNDVKPQDLAYVIYTSGSTGKPKGVQIPHRALVNFIASMKKTPGITSADRLLSVTTLSFDIAGLEIYLPLVSGASLEIVSREVSSDGNQLLSKLNRSAATMMQATPATWRMLLDAGWQGNTRLKALTGGEAVPHQLASQLSQKVESLWNMYGPTETTIWSTVHEIEEDQRIVLVGRPIANTQIFILDRLLQPVPIGVAGELHIGGDGLARGYLGRPELTAEKFISSPFSEDSTARLYKTGDLARYRPNGDIELLGRIDHQVKIRGFRIELGEIEAALRQHPGVNETVVVNREDLTGDTRLVAYIVPAQLQGPETGELRRFLRDKLPEYMVPSTFVMLAKMPLTPNGKVNRRALPAPEQSDVASSGTFVAPQDPVESELVKMWETILRIHPLSIKDDFFELGGHSLLAVRLMQRIEQIFGKKLPVATLFQARTIEQLAAILRHDAWAPRWSYLVPIQNHGSKPVFFCVHGAGGVVLRYYDLARHLGPQQPVYGLQAQGLDEKQPFHTCVEDMAASYIGEIRSVQPHGPYFLGGYSFGGVVAFEIAQQLRAQGEESKLVVLFDTFCPSPLEAKPMAADAELFWKGMSSAIRKFLQAPILKKGAFVLGAGKTIGMGILRRLYYMGLPYPLRKVRKVCQAAAKSYVPGPYPGRVILFRSKRRPLTQFRDPHVGWNKHVIDGVKICEVDGDHQNILLEPQVRFVGEQLKSCLEQAQTTDLAAQLVN